jgi:hypothetical protein
LFKRIWKALDPESRFVGTGGPIDVPRLPRHLDRVHDGVGRVVENPLRQGQVNLDRAAPLDE